MTRLRILSLAVVGLGWSASGYADVESGPKAGEKVNGFEVAVVTGTDAGKAIDFPNIRKETTTVYLFVQSEHWSRPMARFLRDLDGKLGSDPDKLTGVAIWLTANVDEAKGYLPKAQMSIKLANTSMTVFPGDTSGPNGWGINSDAHLTVVVVKNGKVVKSFPFVSVNETDVKPVAETIEKLSK